MVDHNAGLIWKAGLAALLVAIPNSTSAREAPDLYVRVEKKLAANPALASGIGKPAPQTSDLAWLVGEWDIEALVDAAPGRTSERGASVVAQLYGGIWFEIRDTYPTGTQDVGYVGYNAATGRWTTVSIDSVGNANIATSAAGWQGDRIAFEGDFLIVGEKARLRQTITRVSPNEYRVDNDERLGSGWKHLDSYRYTRKHQP